MAELGAVPSRSSTHADAILNSRLGGEQDGHGVDRNGEANGSGGRHRWRYVFLNVWRSMDRERPVWAVLNG